MNARPDQVRQRPHTPPPPRGGRTERHGLSSSIAADVSTAIGRAKCDGVPGGGDKVHGKTPPPGAPGSLSLAVVLADGWALARLSDGAPPSPLVCAEAAAFGTGGGEAVGVGP